MFRVQRLVQGNLHETVLVGADQGVLAASTYTDLGDHLNVVLDREYPKVRGAISDVAETTEQASMFVAELRAQPWRVLQQPFMALWPPVPSPARLQRLRDCC